MGKKTPKTAPSPWDFVTLLVKVRATAMGNKQKKIGKDRACGAGDILADRQTHRYTDRHAHYNTSQPLSLERATVIISKQLTEVESEIDTVWPLYVGHHRARLPPTERLEAVEVCQVTGRVGLGLVSLIADVARLGRAGDARLLAEIFRTVDTARVGRLHRQIERGVDERREAALRTPATVVARPLIGVVRPRRRRMLAGGDRQQPAQHDGRQKPGHTSAKRIAQLRQAPALDASQSGTTRFQHTQNEVTSRRGRYNRAENRV